MDLRNPSLRIDFHTHVFPQRMDQVLEKVSVGPLAELPSRRFAEKSRRKLRQRGRKYVAPLSRLFHSAQQKLASLPSPVRDAVERLGGIALLPSLWVESTSEDLDEAMDQAGIQRALIIAHPPHASNEFILKEAVRHPRLIPVVNVPECEDAAFRLKSYLERGAKALKIHSSADGKGPDHSHYLKLLEVAEEKNIPVILHTGCIQLGRLFRDPHMGEVKRFQSWFRDFPNITFILAHMGFHHPGEVLGLCEQYPQLLVDTSWQSATAIAAAVKRLGAERVLFASDWPIGGQNIDVSLRRLHECAAMGGIQANEMDLILGGNASRVLGIRNATGT